MLKKYTIEVSDEADDSLKEKAKNDKSTVIEVIQKQIEYHAAILKAVSISQRKRTEHKK